MEFICTFWRQVYLLAVKSKIRVGKQDILLISCLLMISFLPLYGILPDESAVRADIVLDGKPYRNVQLTGHNGQETIEITTEKGSNTVLIDDESIAVISADCPDKVCVQAGRLTRPGDVAACLPHGLLIEIKGEGIASDDDIH